MAKIKKSALLVATCMAFTAASLSVSAAEVVSGRDGTSQGHGCEFYAERQFGGSPWKINGGESVAFNGQSTVKGIKAYQHQGKGSVFMGVASLANCEAGFEYTDGGQTKNVTFKNNNDLIGTAVQNNVTGLYCICR